MDQELRRTILFLSLGFWAMTVMSFTQWNLAFLLVPILYPTYRCSQQNVPERRWYRLALIAILVSWISLLGERLELLAVLGIASFYLFLTIGNVRLAYRVGNLRALLLLVFGLLEFFPDAGLLGSLAQGLGLTLLWFTTPTGSAAFPVTTVDKPEQAVFVAPEGWSS